MNSEKQAGGNRRTADAMRNLQAPFEAVPGWFRATALDLPLTVGSEMLHFAARRFEAQANLWQDLSRCQALPEVLQCQADFAQRAMSDYTREFSTLVSKAEGSLAHAAE